MGLLRIKDVEPLAGHRLRLTLTDGTVRERDVSALLAGPVFERIRNDPSVFSQVRVERGTVTWPGDVDLCPDVLIWNGPPPRDAGLQTRDKPMAETYGKYRGTKEFLLVYMELIITAQHRGTTTYPDLAALMGLPLQGNHMQKQVGIMLGEISEDEVRQGRPMLSAVVIGVKSGEPGPGFFTLATQLGLLKEESKDARDRFWENQLQAVYSTWHREPYPKPKKVADEAA